MTKLVSYYMSSVIKISFAYIMIMLFYIERQFKALENLDLPSLRELDYLIKKTKYLFKEISKIR